MKQLYLADKKSTTVLNFLVEKLMLKGFLTSLSKSTAEPEPESIRFGCCLPTIRLLLLLFFPAMSTSHLLWKINSKPTYKHLCMQELYHCSPVMHELLKKQKYTGSVPSVALLSLQMITVKRSSSQSSRAAFCCINISQSQIRHNCTAAPSSTSYTTSDVARNTQLSVKGSPSNPHKHRAQKHTQLWVFIF